MEEWRDIEGFKGYQVSNIGRVRSFKKHNAGRYKGYDVLVDEPHILKQSDDGEGYLKVMFRNDGHSYCRKVHTLVAKAFIPNDDPDYYDTVDHISGNKYDNRVENLQWLTRRENLQKAYSDGVHDRRIKESMVGLFATNVYTDQEYYFDNHQEAADFFGVDRSTISHYLRRSLDAFVGDYILRRLKSR